jgi:hypothetical protein
MISPRAKYQEQIAHYAKEKEKIQGKLKLVPWSRLFFLISTVTCIYFFAKTGEIIFIPLAVLSFGGFLLVGWYDFKLKQRIKELDARIAINKKETDAINGDYAGFEPGTEFINESHAYTQDMDIFGPGSLFQYLNRSSTIFGKNHLADFLSNAYDYRLEILQRQEAIQELSGKIDFRQQIQSIFFGQNTHESDLSKVIDWLENRTADNEQNNQGEKGTIKRFLQFFLFVLPVITISFIILSGFGLMHYRFAIIMIAIQMIFVYIYDRQTKKVHQAISSYFRILIKYSKAFLMIEKASFTAQFNTGLQYRLKYAGQEPPSAVIRRLSRLLNWMDTNLNIFAYIFLNGLFMFNIHILLAVEKWRNRYRKMIPEWFAVLAEFDALSGLAAFSFNNPQYVFPETISNDFILEAKEIGHPLISRKDCVTNDFEINGWKQFFIITGANMSGKSTFLRTLGTNYILAMIGAPVFARKFLFTPIEIHSTIRNNDSLVKGESYFYAELKQLKEIIEELKSGRKILILLDEILKGTNSSDKQSGSIALIKQLLNYNVIGVFATHDVELSKLINSYPDSIRNLCFEISFEGDKMEIDYKLRPGVCKNLNASFLMRKMGIVVE